MAVALNTSLMDIAGAIHKGRTMRQQETLRDMELYTKQKDIEDKEAMATTLGNIPTEVIETKTTPAVTRAIEDETGNGDTTEEIVTPETTETIKRPLTPTEYYTRAAQALRELGAQRKSMGAINAAMQMEVAAMQYQDHAIKRMQGLGSFLKDMRTTVGKENFPVFFKQAQGYIPELVNIKPEDIKFNDTAQVMAVPVVDPKTGKVLKHVVMDDKGGMKFLDEDSDELKKELMNARIDSLKTSTALKGAMVGIAGMNAETRRDMNEFTKQQKYDEADRKTISEYTKAVEKIDAELEKAKVKAKDRATYRNLVVEANERKEQLYEMTKKRVQNADLLEAPRLSDPYAKGSAGELGMFEKQGQTEGIFSEIPSKARIDQRSNSKDRSENNVKKSNAKEMNIGKFKVKIKE